ncbi:MAG: nucleoside triphosphate pyrophosphohydrolase [Candidatus Methanomethylophilaceae archaeon]|jgi:predicted house-cleaning noncanonical NTP pyrophosphatase (MazG superfamily)|nr:nucleoside triphosphate pyrophosphohydrolase [Candidatus Methanomethylophilaceae archaeon]NLF33561.1 nucleoside triphosphate pyrophosphohydrolase [Thermoplasmatales archaeon]
MTEYNKIVRDNVPHLIELDGGGCRTRTAGAEERYELLKRKLLEETGEFSESDEAEELADIMEVVFALAGILGYTEDDLVSMRKRKRKEAGGFQHGIVLEETYRPDMDE